MGFIDDLHTVRKCYRSWLYLTILTSLVAVTAAMSPLSPEDSLSASIVDQNHHNHAARIPFCNDQIDRTIGRRLLYITTLDGRLTALDITKNGKIRWSIPTGPGALISSSIHRLELTNNGQLVRMIPSLSGGIYKFDGESIDPIPITTDHLLSSSAKFSDDLVISGGKETRTYGVSARTGQLLYECSMNGCINSTETESPTNPETLEKHKASNADEDYEKIKLVEHDSLLDDVVVVRRQTQTVRAIESRTGVERWNFSVGQHELDLLKPVECEGHKLSDLDMAIMDIDIKVVVPEGIVCAFSKSQNGLMLWKHKFDHPIVSGWTGGSEGDLKAIDLFGSATQWLWNNEENIFEMPNNHKSPSIYLGMYEKQLYIQESERLRKEIQDQSSLYTQLSSVETHLPKIPWRPIEASSNSLIIYREDSAIVSGTIPPDRGSIQGNELVPYDEDNFAVSAQSVLNASEYVNGNGFYLYSSDDLNKTEPPALCEENDDEQVSENNADILNLSNPQFNNDIGINLDGIDPPVKVVILSLWFWWKEIAVIAFTSAILLNFLMGQRQRTEREYVLIERHIAVPTGIEATEASTNAILGPVTNSSSAYKSSSSSNIQRSISESTNSSGEHFMSRFQTDFEMVRCLGKGGFGVVFEAKNKLDDCKYAIKRITLPNKEESRKRVMREARTLASCEHQNIVRYFHSWVETPPVGWQEQEDNKWLAQEMSTSIQIETPDGTTLPTLPSASTQDFAESPKNFGRRRFNAERKKKMLSWSSHMTTSHACSSDYECDHNENQDDDEDDDSCIVFRTESESLAMKYNDNDDYNEGEIVKNKNNNKEKEKGEERTSENLPKAISIDIHSNSFDLSLSKNGKHLDYSALSDSFQIEFVRSANGDQNDKIDIIYEEPLGRDQQISFRKGKNSDSSSNKSNKRPSSLDLVANYNNNNNNLIPLNGTPPLNSFLPPKPNKVYLYIQMQLCRKESLRDWLRENKTEARLSHIGSIFHQIVDAVDYVHVKGLIHRDLKPSNIFFSQDGQIKIGDFGLVTDMSDIPNLVTKCGDQSGLPSCSFHTQQVGTHLYMSPEQLRGQPYDYKVDIYSLGLIFFELHMYFGTEMERIKTMRSLRDGHYPEEFCQDYPEEHKLLQKMLAKNPNERPQTKELKQQLKTILKFPDISDEHEMAALAEAARRLSSSRTFSSCE